MPPFLPNYLIGFAGVGIAGLGGEQEIVVSPAGELLLETGGADALLLETGGTDALLLEG